MKLVSRAILSFIFLFLVAESVLAAGKGVRFSGRSYLIFSEKPEDKQTKIINEVFFEEINMANMLYPEKPTQILIPGTHNLDTFKKIILNLVGSEESAESENVIWALLGGNPRFCDQEGCSLIALYNSPSSGWEIIWKLPSTGHVFFFSELILFKDQAGKNKNSYKTHIGNENPILGCEIYDSTDLVLNGATGEPCEVWAERYADFLGFHLEKEFRSFEIKARAYGSSISKDEPKIYHILVGSFDPELKKQVLEIVTEFSNLHDLEIQDNGTFFRLQFDQSRVSFNYEMPNFNLRWDPADY